jgi:NAD(P)-dependent dehydrogenase (short-subunit alcohol dehydrogenase family)
MEIAGKVCVVTGGAGGIGSAVARLFSAQGGKVVVADLDGEGAERVAAGIRDGGAEALAVAADVATEDGNIALIAATEEAFGPVDLFHANAGGGGGFGPEAPNDAWDLAWRLNVMAHVWAARHLLPGWLDRGDGYLVTTASMAGILTSLGAGPYATAKHAAVGFAEWLSITYGGQGVKVSCLCPGGVNTKMLAPDGDAAKAAALIGGGAVREPDEVAQSVLDAVTEERFLILSHPEMQEFIERKAVDNERWIKGMRRLWDRGRAAQG